MAKRTMSKQELLEKREELLAEYNKIHPKNKKPATLTKKSKKILGIGRDCGKAQSALLRISPSKVRIVVNIVRGKDVNEALSILQYTPKIASPEVYKVIQSAKANAVNNNGLSEDKLYVADIQVNEGPTMKRFIAAGKGSGRRILKRTCKIKVVLKERAEA